MKNLKIILMVILSFSIWACKGTSKDPKTNDRSELNPPGDLQTITMDKKITLTWVGGNAEDDFQGYHVFGVAGSVASLDGKYTFPSKSLNLAEGESIPRCEDNTAFFEAFGFPKSEAGCDTSEEETSETSEVSNNSNGSSLSADEVDEDAITFNVPCADHGKSGTIC